MRAKHSLRGRKGNALVVALLLLVTLTSVGIVAVQRTSADVNATSAFVKNRQARAAADSGAVFATKNMSQLLYQTISQIMNTNVTNKTVNLSWDVIRDVGNNPSCMSTAIPNPVGNPNYIPTVQPGAFNLNIRMLQDSAFSVKAFQKQEKATGVPGNQVNASSGAGLVCQQVFDFTSTAGLPSAALTEPCNVTLNENSATGNIILKTRMRSVMFPGPCTLR